MIYRPATFPYVLAALSFRLGWRIYRSTVCRLPRKRHRKGRKGKKGRAKKARQIFSRLHPRLYRVSRSPPPSLSLSLAPPLASSLPRLRLREEVRVGVKSSDFLGFHNEIRPYHCSGGNLATPTSMTPLGRRVVVVAADVVRFTRARIKFRRIKTEASRRILLCARVPQLPSDKTRVVAAA